MNADDRDPENFVGQERAEARGAEGFETGWWSPFSGRPHPAVYDDGVKPSRAEYEDERRW